MSNYSGYLSKRKYGGAKGRHKSGQMNSLETWYKNILDNQKHAGMILEYWFEEFKFRLADKTFYTPDFIVMNKEHELEVHECKGYMLDDANVKIKVAAEHFPFRFFVVKKVKGSISIKEVGNSGTD